MEMGGGSGGGGATAGGGSGGGGDSINGLTFGKKIYFEDVGIGASGKASGGSTSNSAAAVAARKVRGVSQGGGPPRCQVEGCNVDLSDVKAYYSRHKVCAMHSKSPKVIVGGVEQRFCQQCSRFHLLPEFDQGKRSCRRRLAGHNERRRKPQPGSLFSSRYGRVSSFQENGSRVGGFLMDFTTYPRMMGRDAWPTTKAANWADGNQPTPTGKLLPHQWQGNSESPVYSQPYLQGGTGGTVFSSTRIPSSECFAAVSDSSCALSLLSNQPWGSRNHSDLEVNNLVNGGVTVAQSAASHSSAATNFTGNTWGFKGNNEVTGGLHAMPHDFCLGMVSQPVNSHFSGELELAQQGDRQYVELGHSRDFGSSAHQMHWSH